MIIKPLPAKRSIALPGAPKPAVNVANVCKLPWYGNRAARMLFVVDPVILTDDGEIPYGGPLSPKSLQALAPFMKEVGIKSTECLFVSAAMPCSQSVWGRDKALGDHIKADHEQFLKLVGAMKPSLIVAMGKAAIRQVANRPVKITKVRGVAYHDPQHNAIVMPVLGINHIMRAPEHNDVFVADLKTVKEIVNNSFQVSKLKKTAIGRYEWCTDLSVLLAKRPKIIGLDSEASAFGHGNFASWHNPFTKVMTIQIADRPGHAYVIPIDYPKYKIDQGTRGRVISQLRALLSDPNVQVCGHNLKYDRMLLKAKLSINIANYADDTILLIHALNENMLNKSLDEVTRVFLPEMAGYKDEFRRKYNEHSGNDNIMARMDLVEPEDILAYSGADADAALQLRNIMLGRLQQDGKALNCYNRVVMPAMRAFCDVEVPGFKINVEALHSLHDTIAKHQAKEYKRLMAMIPMSIQNKFKDTGVGLKLTREVLLRDFLFNHPDGLQLPARTFTKTGLASTSTKLHLPYFVDKHPFIKAFIDYAKNDKMLTTYIGVPEDNKGNPTGFYKYIEDGYIHPTYQLHGTATGRSSSRDPNGQNFPKRGPFVKAYRAIFEAPKGWILISADYSQLELRIAGILAKEPTFLEIYRTGGDIHCSTAAVVMGMTLEQFMQLKEVDPDTFALQRFRAKAVNFGFIYGMGWRKFMVYAKTEYGIDYTEDEAKRIRLAFFTKYSALQGWHLAVREFVRKHRYVRALDGRIRHLPAAGILEDDDDPITDLISIASAAERQAINAPVQALGSDFGLIAIALLNASLDKSKCKLIGFVHDAIIAIAKEGYEIEMSKTIQKVMANLPLKEWFGFTPPIPIISEVEMGRNLAKAIEIKKSWSEDKRIVSFKQIEALHAVDEIKKDLRSEKNVIARGKLSVALARAKRHADYLLANPPVRPRSIIRAA